MIEIRFTLYGNHENRNGNPLPKLRMTGPQHWRPEVKRYVAWKTFVQVALVEALNERHPPAAREAAKNIALLGKPLALGDREARMDLKIHWHNGVHGDPESIFGSIADALFYNDKHLAGSFEFEYSAEGKGSVDILLTISEQRTWQKTKRPSRSTSRSRRQQLTSATR